jgi:hypothetical protein
VSEPIDIPNAEQGEYISVYVRTPNGTEMAVQVYDAPSHPANITALKSAVEEMYGQLFQNANVDPYTNPVQIYTIDWADIGDDSQLIADGEWFGVCWTDPNGGQVVGAGQASEEEIFQFEP